MAAQRDAKGRFIPKSKTEATPAKAKAVVKTSFKVGESISRVLATALSIFDKKSADGDPVRMKEGTEVTLEKLADVGPTGTHLIRVKKSNSHRIFYTIEENLKGAVKI